MITRCQGKSVQLIVPPLSSLFSPAGSQSAQTWRVKQFLSRESSSVNNKLIKSQIFPLNQLPKLLGGSNRAQRWVAQQNSEQMPPILRRKNQANLLLVAPGSQSQQMPLVRFGLRPIISFAFTGCGPLSSFYVWLSSVFDIRIEAIIACLLDNLNWIFLLIISVLWLKYLNVPDERWLMFQDSELTRDNAAISSHLTLQRR